MREASGPALPLLLLTLGACASVACASVACASVASAQSLEKYETAYYVIHTDIPVEDAREAAIRMTKMFDEYTDRTRDFTGGQIRSKLPFYLFRSNQDYYRAGGLPGSAGVFDGSRLMAIFGDKATGGTWHVVQHEGFHQFARAVIGGEIPTWANEGLADYFGHAVWTGDSFISGLVPPARMKRVQAQISANAFRPLPEMMIMSRQQWNAGLSRANYDQGWSMVHFLAHGDNGKYQQAFGSFLKDLNARRPWRNAWLANFGGDVEAFEAKWKEYWLKLPENPTGDLYAKATTATLASFLARAYAQKQTFDTFDEFIKSAESAQLKMSDEEWLPQSLLKNPIDFSKKTGTWSLAPGDRGTRQIVCLFDEKTKWIGRFQLDRNRVARVWVDSDIAPANIAQQKPPPVKNSPNATVQASPAPDESSSVQPVPRPASRPAAPSRAAPARPLDPVASAMSLARSYARSGDKAKARATLEKAIAGNPNSPSVREARELLKELK